MFGKLNKFENVSSHLDMFDTIGTPLLLHGRPLQQGQFGHEIYPVVMPSGLVMLNPRWVLSEYVAFYENEYDSLYRLDTKPDIGIEGVRSNAREIISRLLSYDAGLEDSVTTFLDAGAGPGFGLMDYRDKFKHSKFYAIEGSKAARDVLASNKFAEIIGNFVDSETVNIHKNKFNLIVLRHVVEHFLDPILDLGNIAALLKEGVGRCYIAVPDMLHPRTVLRDYDDWWEYWFRSVHTYYYNRYTLFKTLSLAGLEVVKWGEEKEELWCIVKKMSGSSGVFDYDYSQVFKKQMSVIEGALP